MTVGEIMDNAFRVFADHCLLLLGIGLVAQVPFGLCTWWMVAFVSSSAFVSDSGPMLVLLPLASWLVAVLVVGPLGTAATTKALGDVYLDQAASVFQSYRHVLSLSGPFLSALLLYGLLVMLGFILLVIPGILVMLGCAFLVQVVMVERLGAMSALRRSRALVNGRKGRVVALFLLLALLDYILWRLLALTGFTGLLRITFLTLGRAVTGAFSAAVWTVAYFEARCSAEGLDLQRLAASLGTPAAADSGSEADT